MFLIPVTRLFVSTTRVFGFVRRQILHVEVEPERDRRLRSSALSVKIYDDRIPCNGLPVTGGYGETGFPVRAYEDKKKLDLLIH